MQPTPSKSPTSAERRFRLTLWAGIFMAIPLYYVVMRMAPPEEDAINILVTLFVKAQNDAAAQVMLACNDSYKRLLSMSIIILAM